VIHTDDESAVTDVGAPIGRRRSPRWLAAAYAVAGLLLVTAVAVGIVSQATLRRTNNSLAAVRAELHQTSEGLTTARAGLATVTGESNAAGLTLLAEAHQLSSTQAALAHTQATISAQGVNIWELNLCLAGVEKALNAIAVGDQALAVNSLQNVASNCAAASPPTS
jgi:hypothetical protein